jgi:hypothetical protein
MQKNENEDLNNNRNQGFDWMLDSQSNNKEEQIFNFNLQKSVSFFSRNFQISVMVTGSKKKERKNVRNSSFY